MHTTPTAKRDRANPQPVESRAHTVAQALRTLAENLDRTGLGSMTRAQFDAITDRLRELAAELEVVLDEVEDAVPAAGVH